ncbi:MAG: S8 family serine peptidase [Actinomycetota bacterium]
MPGSPQRLSRLVLATVVAVVATVAAAVGASSQEVPAAAASGAGASTTGRLMVEVRPQRADLVAGAADGAAVGNGWVVVDPGDRTAEAVTAELLARSDVLDVRPEVWFTAAVVPDDPCYDDALDCQADVGTTEDQEYLDRIGAPDAWDVTTGSDGVVVAVLDSGVRASHDDFAGKVVDWSECGVAEAPDGFFVDPSHGTRVAGMVGASTNDGAGIASLGWDTTVADVPVLFQRLGFTTLPQGREGDVVNAIRCATSRGADVINMSFTGGSTPSLAAAIADAAAADVVLVAAAGNGGTSTPLYPAAYPEVVGVGAVDENDVRSNFSSFGDWVSVTAPGEQLLSIGASSDEDYDAAIQGTSFSAPLVAALAALVRAAHPTWSAPEIVARIERTSVAFTGSDTAVAHGRIDAGAALTADREGYWIVTADGTVLPFGDAVDWGEPDLPGTTVVALAPAPDGRGYWIADDAGNVYAFGSATFLGSMGGQPLNEPIVGMAATAAGDGYWLVASDGGIFAFGAATFLGSMGGQPLNEPIVAMANDPDGDGYWLVASDGGIFAFGAATFLGSMGGLPLNQPVVSMASTGSGDGYWLVATDGGVFAFGDAPFHGSTGSLVLNQPIVGMTATSSGDGYRMVAADGGIFSFAGADFFGSAADVPLTAPAAATGGFS